MRCTARDISKKVHSLNLKAQKAMFTGVLSLVWVSERPRTKTICLVDEETALICVVDFLDMSERSCPNYIRKIEEENPVPHRNWNGLRRNTRTKWESTGKWYIWVPPLSKTFDNPARYQRQASPERTTIKIGMIGEKEGSGLWWRDRA